MGEIQNILSNIDIIYKKKEIISELTKLLKPLDFVITQTFDIAFINNKFHLIPGTKYNAIYNSGGGDCFFHSIIDSGIQIKNDSGEILNTKYKNDRLGFVKALRQLAVDRIKFLHITNYNYANQTDWHNKIINTNEWADNHTIAALCQEIAVTPIILEVPTNIIICGIATSSKYESTIKIPYDNDNITHTLKFNDLDRLKASSNRFVIIYHQKDFHFEAIYVKHGGDYIKSFDKFADFEKYNLGLATNFISMCELMTPGNELIKEIETQENALKKLEKTLEENPTDPPDHTGTKISTRINLKKLLIQALQQKLQVISPN